MNATAIHVNAPESAEEDREDHDIACDFCGLPVLDLAAPTTGPIYCCYGCRFAASVTAAGGDEGQARWTMTRLGIAVFFSMNVMVFTMLLWSQPENSDALARAWYDVGRYACLLFTLPVIFLLGGPLVDDALAELQRGRASLSMLLLVGVGASLSYSAYSLTTGGHVYFEVACAILVAVTLGRWFEAKGKLQTTEALRGLARLLPDQVRYVVNDHEEARPATDMKIGDLFRVLAGERIAADGVIVLGETAIDTQVINGESVPVPRRAGDIVYSGTLVVDGAITIRATAAAGEGTISRMIAAVKQAAAGRSKYERLAEQVSRWFLPIVSVVALAAFTAHASRGDLGAGILAALAVIVIACPCALGLATPMALWAALGRAAQNGILIREGDALNRLAQAHAVCFDKTGTLTTGTAVVSKFITFNASTDEALAWAGSLAGASNHPLSLAVTNYVREHSLAADSRKTTGDFVTYPGRGITRKTARGELTYLGSRRWLRECGQLPDDAPLETSVDEAETLLAWGGAVRGQFLFRESLRPHVEQTVKRLQAEGLRTVMLTGDREVRARRFTQPLGLECRAELLPDDKLAALHSIMRETGRVVMVGDGINDAPALAAADVGVALGSGADISRHTAGVCLLRDDLASLPWLIELSRATVHTIRWNLLWALLYNVIGVGLAAAGWLHPILAAIAMAVSSFLVISNSLMLAHFPVPGEQRAGATPS